MALDHELWERSNRDRYKRLIEEHGGRWRLVYFKADAELLRRRLAERNEAPSGEGEVVIDQAETAAARTAQPR